jgi:1-phosphofructokinase family hexose kinase
MIFTVTLNPSLDKYFVVDHVRSDAVNRGTIREVNAGGKGINVSRFLKVLGVDSVILTFIGGYVGQTIKKDLVASGFSVLDFESEGNTRENITLFSEENSEIYKLNEFGPTISADEMEKFLSTIAEMADAGDIWVLSGSLPPGVSDDVYVRMIEILHAKKAQVLIDTSRSALRSAVSVQPDYIHMNADEVAEFCGMEIADRNSLVLAVKALMKRYSFKGLLCSLGEDGALLAFGKEIYHIAAPNVRVVSTTGAGDAMVSAFLFALKQGCSVEEMGRWAVAAGTTKVTIPGTDVFRMEDVQANLRKTKVNKIR